MDLTYIMLSHFLENKAVNEKNSAFWIKKLR